MLSKLKFDDKIITPRNYSNENAFRATIIPQGFEGPYIAGPLMAGDIIE